MALSPAARNRLRAVVRWFAALVGVGAVGAVLWTLLAHELGSHSTELGPAHRRINTVVDLGDDGATDCSAVELRRGDAAPDQPLRPQSTACVVVGVVDDQGDLRWFFVGQGHGDGTVTAPKPTKVGLHEVLLDNGAVVPIGDTVRVRCSPDPNERFESWIARGLATASYLDAKGALVAIDCTTTPK